MRSELLMAINQLAAEKGLPREVVLRTTEQALATAMKKDTMAVTLPLVVKINPTTGDMRIFLEKQVVEEVSDPESELTLEEARRTKPLAEVGDTLEEEVSIPAGAGRIAAQTAKQVLLQRLREAEHNAIFEEFHAKEGEVLTGIVQRVEPRQIILDLGRGEAVLPMSEQVKSERYRPGQRLKVYLLEVQRGARGTQVLVSRSHKNLLRRLVELEVPEIQQGVVEIKGIAREPGSRSKLAVFARQPGVDPVGCCVGQRGIRIQGIVRELGGERIDVVVWDTEVGTFIQNALSPAQVIRVDIKDEENTAEVVVPDRQLSLAIGKEGQNARLAAKLTGWRIDIKSASVAETEKVLQKPPVIIRDEAAAVVTETPAPEAVPSEAPVAKATTPEAEVPAAPAPAAAPVEAAPAETVEVVAEPVAQAQIEPVEVAEAVTPEAPAEEAPVEEALSFEEVFTRPIPTAPIGQGGLRFAEDIPELRRGGQGGRRRRQEETKGKRAKKRAVTKAPEANQK
ncbi:MAG: transcription termination factor NusA [Dehalococcoidia bacterium]